MGNARDANSYQDGEQANPFGQLTQTAQQKTEEARSQARSAVQTAQEKAGEYGEKLSEQAEARKERAAGGIESAAEKVRETASGHRVAKPAGTKLAEGMEQTATYVRERETSDIVRDLARFIRQHPMQAFLGGIVLGFLAGRIFK
jgi:ElaB/YqjD/DUF883 family membrane-anchored ribosome-binding protein